MDNLVLIAIIPESVYELDADTNLLYRFIGNKRYMQNSARAIQTHKFAAAMAECYLIPDYKE